MRFRYPRHSFSLQNEFIFSNPQCHVQGGNEDYSFNNLWLQYLLNFSPYWQHLTYRHHISAKHWQYQFTLATVLLHCFLRIGIFTSILKNTCLREEKLDQCSVCFTEHHFLVEKVGLFPSFGLYSGLWLKQQIVEKALLFFLRFFFFLNAILSCFYLFIFKNFIGVSLLKSIVLVSAVQRSESAYKYTYPLFFGFPPHLSPSFPFRSPQSIE